MVGAISLTDQRDEFYALLVDGTTVEICPARPEDHGAVRDMHAVMSSDNMYLRFFDQNPCAAEQEAARVCRAPGDDHAALLAWLGSELVGVTSYEVTGKQGVAEVAFTVADGMNRRGVATLLSTSSHMLAASSLRSSRQRPW